MVLLVLFDLPTKSPQERRCYAQFRKKLEYGGFVPLQYSVYMRSCPSVQAADRHVGIVEAIAPPRGHISILRVTEQQMVKMVNIHRAYKENPAKITPTRQLTIF